MKKALFLVSLAAANIMFASAQVSISISGGNTANGGGLTSLIALVQKVVNQLAPLALGLAVIVFFYYIIKYILQGGESADAKAASLKGMGYSLIALFVMVSVWGIISFAGNLLGIGQGGSVPYPTIPSGPTN